MTEKEILDFLSSVETGVITDAMKLLGLDGWMEDILPLAPDARVCGRAFTVQYERLPDSSTGTLNIFEMMETPSPGSILVLSVPSRHAIVGENILHAAVVSGLAGMVLDGKARDSGIIRREGLPLFCRGPAIRLETECKIAAVQTPVQCGGVVVRPGDYIVGDCDGVIALHPENMEALIYQAERIAAIERDLEQTIQSGRGMSAVAAVSAQKKQLRP